MVFTFTRIKLYHMHSQPEPVASPRASFVPVKLDFAPLRPPPLYARIRSALWTGLVTLWRFMYSRGTSRSSATSGSGPRRVQQLDMWAPGETELRVFCIYSPVHALMWSATTGENWMIMWAAMAGVSAQLHLMMRAYEALIKDKTIVAAEVMHEYNEKVRARRISFDACLRGSVWLTSWLVREPAREPYTEGRGDYDQPVGNCERLGGLTDLYGLDANIFFLSLFAPSYTVFSCNNIMSTSTRLP
jgi:hypothetical protein